MTLRLAKHHGPATPISADVPLSLGNAVKHFAARHPEGRNAAVAELLERGLASRFVEVIEETFRGFTLAAKKERAGK